MLDLRLGHFPRNAFELSKPHANATSSKPLQREDQVIAAVPEKPQKLTRSGEDGPGAAASPGGWEGNDDDAPTPPPRC